MPPGPPDRLQARVWGVGNRSDGVLLVAWWLVGCQTLVYSSPYPYCLDAGDVFLVAMYLVAFVVLREMSFYSTRQCAVVLMYAAVLNLGLASLVV